MKMKKQKQVLVFVIIAVVAVVILAIAGYFACKYYTAKQNQTAGWQTYKNDEFGYEIKYPNFVDVRDAYCPTMCRVHDKAYIGFTEGDGKSFKEYLVIQMIADGYLFDGKSTINTPLQEITQAFWKATKESKDTSSAILGSIKEADLGGQKVYVFSSEKAIILPGVASSLDYKTDFFFFSTQNGKKGILYFPEKESKIVNQMLSTFKFTK